MVIGIAIQLSRANIKFKYKTSPKQALPPHMPTVSVCIPARNETHAMTACLESVLASSYPKLEVLVFDDNSYDNTSYLIKSFAHAGVRFVDGSELSKGWLGKNRALEALLQQSSGDYVFFMDVDTRVTSNSITDLVMHALNKQSEMVSILPKRLDTWRSSAQFGTLRYFWKLILWSDARPPVAGAAWLIKRRTFLRTIKSFSSVRNITEPETVIARMLTVSGNYTFLIATTGLGVSYEKRWLSQLETSTRLLYPAIGMRMSRFIFWLIGFMILLLPIALICMGIHNWNIVQTVSLWQLVLFTALYAYYCSITRGRYGWIGGIVWPYIILQEAALFILSMVGYRRNTITWKGRLIRPSAHMGQIK